MHWKVGPQTPSARWPWHVEGEEHVEGVAYAPQFAEVAQQSPEAQQYPFWQWSPAQTASRAQTAPSGSSGAQTPAAWQYSPGPHPPSLAHAVHPSSATVSQSLSAPSHCSGWATQGLVTR